MMIFLIGHLSVSSILMTFTSKTKTWKENLWRDSRLFPLIKVFSCVFAYKQQQQQYNNNKTIKKESSHTRKYFPSLCIILRLHLFSFLCKRHMKIQQQQNIETLLQHLTCVFIYIPGTYWFVYPAKRHSAKGLNDLIQSTKSGVHSRKTTPTCIHRQQQSLRRMEANAWFAKESYSRILSHDIYAYVRVCFLGATVSVRKRIALVVKLNL